ncbi:MAG: hypothetical protein K2Q07_09225 [Burkholderiaceae bacterium]|nr:hypothetical protein [Burkholderiaceae bacterium]
MSYTPRAGSIAERAHQQLTLQGELSGAALADAIDLDDRGTLQPSLSIALREGYISKTTRNGFNYYRVGDGVPLKPTGDDVDDDPPVQRVVPAKAVAVATTPPPRPKAKAKPPKPAQTPALALQPAEVKDPPAGAQKIAQPPGAEPVFGRFTDGRVVIEKGDQRIDLDSKAAGRLYAFLVDGE